MGQEDNFGNKIGKGDFRSNPQNINKKGRPRKSFSTINIELKEKGIKPLAKSDLLDAYSLIFNLTENELKELGSDKDTPYLLRLIILELNSKSTRSKALLDYRDWMFGKASQTVDVTTQGDKLQLSSSEQLAKLEDLKKKIVDTEKRRNAE